MVVVFDLDDTLYDEIDFVKSGFKEVAKYLSDNKYYDFMWQSFNNYGSGRIFDNLIEYFNLNVSLNKLIEIYRFHMPDISLSNDARAVLEFTRNYKTALISDGHYITQQNKFNALKLNEYIDYPVFTDLHNTKKPCEKAFKMVMKQFKDEQYIYIADNPQKDFIAPNKLDWFTIRYKNSNGIYKDVANSADVEVESRQEIIGIVRNIKG